RSHLRSGNRVRPRNYPVATVASPTAPGSAPPAVPLPVNADPLLDHPPAKPLGENHPDAPAPAGSLPPPVAPPPDSPEEPGPAAPAQSPPESFAPAVPFDSSC